MIESGWQAQGDSYQPGVAERERTLTLSALIKKGGLANRTAATVAIVAIQETDQPVTVAAAKQPEPVPELTPEEASNIRAWLVHIEESNSAIIAGVEAIAGWWDTDRRYCECFLTRPQSRAWPRVLGNVALIDVKRAMLVDILDDVVERGARVMANHLFGDLRQFFNFAIAREWIGAHTRWRDSPRRRSEAARKSVTATCCCREAAGPLTTCDVPAQP